MYKISISIIAVLLILSITSCKKDNEEGPKEIIKIGALLPLTGDLSTKGLNAKAGIELAALQINAWFVTQDIHKEIELIIKDTENDETFTLAYCKQLKEDSINVIIGPMISNNLAFIRDYCIQNGLSLISPSSTNPDLAIADDNIYRLAPGDRQQAKALAKTMIDDGIKKIITFMKLGAWEAALNTELSSSFETLGGEMAGVIPFNPKGTDNFEEDILMLCDQINEVLTETTANDIAIMMIGFDEGVNIMNECSEMEDFAQIRWYASDGLTLSDNLVNDEIAADFAYTHQLSSPLFAEPDTDSYENIKAQIKEKSGYTAGIYAVNAYDACWIAAMNLNEISTYTAAAFSTNLSSLLQNYTAATGSIELNASGDRSNVFYDIWQITLDEGNYKWIKMFTIKAD